MLHVGHHELKSWPEHFQSVWGGDKKFEIRNDDRSFRVNDTILLREWDPNTKQYSGRTRRVRVTYVYRGPLVAEGYCVMSVKKLPDIG